MKIKEKATPGLNKFVLNMIKKHIKTDSKILIAGSGNGAFEEKIITKLNFNPKNITSVDINPKQFKFKGIDCKKVDLNKNLPFKDDYFDLIISIEVIEHLENQWNFIKEIARIKKNNGLFALTSPNIEGVFNRFYFFLTRKFSGFSFKDYEISGHISPLFSWNLERMLRKNKLKIVGYL